jgi:hypothetical protein
MKGDIKNEEDRVCLNIPFLLLYSLVGYWIAKWAASGTLMPQVVYIYQLAGILYAVLTVNAILSLADIVIPGEVKFFLFVGFACFQAVLGEAFFRPELLVPSVPAPGFADGLFVITAFAAVCCGAVAVFMILALMSLLFFLLIHSYHQFD